MRVNVYALALILGIAAGASAQDRDAETAAGPPAPQLRPGALLTEPDVLKRGVALVSPFVIESRSERDSGFFPETSGMITGAGWISGGGGYRQWLGRKAFIEASGQLSWHTSEQEQVRFEMPALAGFRLAIGTQILWQDLTQIHYFGVGSVLPETASEYRMETTDVVGHATYRPLPFLSIEGRIGRLDRATISSPSGWFDKGYPDTRLVFPDDPGVAVRPPGYVHGEVSVTADTRDYPGYPSQGGVYRTAWAHYSDRDLDAYSFHRFEAEVARFVPIVPDRWTIAVRGWGVWSMTPAGQVVPFFLMPSLGGDNSLRGELNYRYHDNDLLLVNAESRFGLFEHVEAAVFVDAGNVARNASSQNLDRRSYGAGVRIHTRTSMLMRLDVAHGEEQGWRVMCKLGDVLRMSRIDRVTATAPFAP